MALIPTWLAGTLLGLSLAGLSEAGTFQATLSGDVLTIQAEDATAQEAAKALAGVLAAEVQFHVNPSGRLSGTFVGSQVERIVRQFAEAHGLSSFFVYGPLEQGQRKLEAVHFVLQGQGAPPAASSVRLGPPPGEAGVVSRAPPPEGPEGRQPEQEMEAGAARFVPPVPIDPDALEKFYVGSKSRQSYYRLDCPTAMSLPSDDKMWFLSLAQARASGMRFDDCTHWEVPGAVKAQP